MSSMWIKVDTSTKWRTRCPTTVTNCASARSSRRRAATPSRPSALAQLSEQAGLDLVTFQDHPYQPGVPGHLDAADAGSRRSTERMRISANVLNLPLRPPAVLARAAASLDLLSGGRFELGLGAGGVLGRDRGDGRPAAAPRARRSTRSARRSTSSAASGTPASAAPLRVDGELLPGQRRQARPGAGARHPDLARRLQAADAAADRRARPTAGCPSSATCSRRTSPRGNATHRRGGARRRAATRARSGACSTSAASRARGGFLRPPSSGSTSCCRWPRGRRRHVHPRPATTRARSSASAEEVAPGAARGGRRRTRASRGRHRPGRRSPAGPRSQRRRRASTTTRCPPSLAGTPSSRATAGTRGSARPTCAPAPRAWSCGPRTPPRWPRR